MASPPTKRLGRRRYHFVGHRPKRFRKRWNLPAREEQLRTPVIVVDRKRMCLFVRYNCSDLIRAVSFSAFHCFCHFSKQHPFYRYCRFFNSPPIRIPFNPLHLFAGATNSLALVRYNPSRSHWVSRRFHRGLRTGHKSLYDLDHATLLTDAFLFLQ